MNGLWQTDNLGSREDAVIQYVVIVPSHCDPEMDTENVGRRALDSDDPMTIMSCIMLCINFIRADEKLA